MGELSTHKGWKMLVKSAKINPSEKFIEAIQIFAEGYTRKMTDLVTATEELAELEKARADLAETRLARVEAYRDTCVILGNDPSTAGLARALRDDDAPVRRAHNHPPYDPVCNERRIGDIVRGACLTDDGRDVR